MRIRLFAGVALVAAGCASHPAPTEQVASSIAAVRGAEEVGAREVPEAALHLKLAEEQIALAKEKMENEENQRAEDLALRAYQDAELALALARENQAKKRMEEFAQTNTAGGEQIQNDNQTSPNTTPGQTIR